MRIISGSLRGKRLLAPKGMEIRPTSDRVKEAFFDIIQFEVAGAVFLDLFSGTGQVGIEALSREARRTVFVDSSKDAIALTKRNLSLTGLAGSAEIIESDFAAYLLTSSEKFDLAYLDPPYGKEILESALPMLQERIRAGGAVFCEHPSQEKLPDTVGDLKRIKVYRYGKTSLSAYRLS